MKKTVFLLVATMLAFTTLYAQKQSDMFVSGTVSFTKTTDVDASYQLKPTIGYFVTNKLAVGVLGEVSKSSTEEVLNIGAFGRYHFLTVGKNCQVFSQLSLANNSTTVAGVKTSGFGANLGLGSNYFVTKRLGLTMDLTNLITYSNVDSKSTINIGFDGVVNPFAIPKFGVIYNF
jgi:outer membrane protein W